MIPELGHLALTIALFIAVALSIVPLAGSFTGHDVLMKSSRSLAAGLFVFLSVAFALLTTSFLQDDFSVKYVANHSNSLLPDHYKISAVWGGHEGSLLLWAWILAVWTLSVGVFSRHMPLDVVARVLSVMGMISIGFLAFMLLTSNPFDRFLPNAPQDGGDLNPLLQDPGLIFHPPMLYMGYVGLSVVFAFAIAALISGRLDSAWARWSRPWTTVAWCFLTLGISLGSWWAYYELGWGGWWFWDPVENASFMPWLVATALIHSLAVTEKRGVFKSWTLLLAIFAFSLSLLGTFLVRSGVLTSVHAFATDPERGVFILMFLLFVIGGSLILYALRAPVMKNVASFDWSAREMFLLGNNILLVIVMATVLLGTLYPLIADALGWGKISVGPPYFNAFFLPLMGLLVFLMGWGAMANWKRTRGDIFLRWLSKPMGASLIIGLLMPFIWGEYQFLAAVTVWLGSWLTLATLTDVVYKTRNAENFAVGLKKLTPSFYGMVVAHIGVAVTLVGIGLTAIYSEQRDVRMEPGQTVSLTDIDFTFVELKKIRGPNYISDMAIIEVSRDGNFIEQLQPEKRRYLSGGNLMTEAGIEAGLFADIYVAMGEALQGDAWAIRVHVKPFVRWIWLGTIFMALGGLLAVIDKRYRVRKKAPAEQPAVAAKA
ncbi:heme lyase CcmF/NrfE family subunit [Maricurvus nonylphenolicus]|uniref:heme lyase CcmF/NrfE family subunit n=1 Tax=Maricurvus nonylphenolicus TaxID=1008307 RepID=UPI0036F255D5